MKSNPNYNAPTTSSYWQITTTIRYDPSITGLTTDDFVYQGPYYLLDYHRDRLVAAARDFKWPLGDIDTITPANGIAALRSWLDTHLENGTLDRTQAWRIQVLIERSGKIIMDAKRAPDCGALIPSILPSGPRHVDNTDDDLLWRVYVDTEPTTPSKFTTHKTSRREMYDAARTRAGITSFDSKAEVLLWNENYEIMEGSITTPYFHSTDSRRGWCTPSLASGGNAGTTRRYALSRLLCISKIVKVEELKHGDYCLISNGVRGFLEGAICLNQ